MTADQALEAIHALAPKVIERARRLEMAMRLLREGKSRREASAIIFRSYSVSRVTAWRDVGMAHDMAGPVENRKP